MNHKRVARLMGEDNLLCLRRRFTVCNSGHRHVSHLNLAARMELTGLDQLWVADITYIRLAEQFVYLAVVLDAYSRRVVGWALDERLDATLAVCALRQAIDARQPAAGLVHPPTVACRPRPPTPVCSRARHRAQPVGPATLTTTPNAKAQDTQTGGDLHSPVPRPGRSGGIESSLSSAITIADTLHSALDYQTPEDFERNLLEARRT